MRIKSLSFIVQSVSVSVDCSKKLVQPVDPAMSENVKILLHKAIKKKNINQSVVNIIINNSTEKRGKKIESLWLISIYEIF